MTRPAGHPLTATDLAIRPLGGSRVLVLDPDPDGAASTAAVLRLGGFNADEVSTAADAFGFLAATKPRAVVMDVDLPDADPWQVVRLVRAVPHPPAVVVVTGDTNPARRAAATAAGVAAFLLKPADPQTLVGIVQGLC